MVSAVEDPSVLERNAGIVRDAAAIPFPSLDNVVVQSVMKAASTSPDSNQTSSDKLSALPTSTSNAGKNRLRRSPTLTASSIFPGRLYRRSLDASTPLPSFSTADFNTIPNIRKGTHISTGSPARATVSDGSIDKEASKQRVSFDSECGTPNLRQGFSRIKQGSDPLVPSPAIHTTRRESPHKEPDPNSHSPSHSRSRAASPLRFLQNWTSNRHRHRHAPEEPFIPVDPFTFKTRHRFPFLSSGNSLHTIDTAASPDGDVCVPPSAFVRNWENARQFFGDTLPRQVYVHLLLRLPAMYFTRVSKIFEDAEVSRPDIQRMIESGGGGSAFLAFDPVPFGSPELGNHASTAVRESSYPPGSFSPNLAAGIGLSGHVGAAATAGASAAQQMPLPFPDDWSPPLVSPALVRFKYSWEAFIDSLLREWKTLNVVSALLLSAILTTFQVPNAADDPVVRTPALVSLICALMSLSYGCMYIVRFGTMRSMFRASRWAEEARKTNTAIWWNVWVLLAMPAVWMSWSMIAFLTSILSFVWRTGSTADPANPMPLGPKGALAARVAITSVFVLGMVYFALIVRTLRGYGVTLGPPKRRPPSAWMGVRQTPRMRDVELELQVALERRGRERERSVSGSVRRREEARTVDVGGEESEGGSRDGGRGEKGGLRAILGLGLVGLHDLEKGIGGVGKSTNEKGIQ